MKDRDLARLDRALLNLLRYVSMEMKLLSNYCTVYGDSY